MEELKALLSSFGRVVGSGSREDLLYFDVDRAEPFTKEDYEKLEKLAEEKGLFVKVINASSALNKELGKEVQRIWLVAFEEKSQLESWLKSFEERRKADHRFLGEQLDLFHIEEELIGPGLPLLHPKGMVIRLELIEFIREINRKLGAQEIWTPHISKSLLWKMSGHYEHYRDKMFLWEQDGEEFGLKPMNCPMHIQIYRFRPRSYRELPIRYAEFATVYRKEQSGELHGLARVWSLTQDDHHFFVRPDQIEQEVVRILKAVVEVYEKFGFEYKVKLSTKPDDAIGSAELWEVAENALINALKKAKLDFELKPKEGAFYGPKIDFDVKDSLARWWQLATIQLDFFMPMNFDLKYVKSDGSFERPVMIHFAILGSIERFMAMLIEHTKGKLPFWLAPVQVAILPVSEAQHAYAYEIFELLQRHSIRVELREEGTLAKRIRNAIIEKIPVIAVVGDREAGARSVNVRGIGNLSLEEFLNRLVEAKRERKSEI